jgi:histidinol phosphatase-like PHP family hydrolase
MARQAKARLILNSDTHSPHDLVNGVMARKIAMGAGLAEAESLAMFRNSKTLLKKVLEA